ncbi:MAG: hypothetical protein QM500_12570 [Methylococcales bacterium]
MSSSINGWYKLSVFSFSVFAALYFQIAWQYPVVDGFPLAERMIDSSFNPSDFYTNTFTDYSPRFIVANFYIIGANLFNVHYTEFIAYANIIRIFVTFIAIFYLYTGLIKDKKVALIAFFISSLCFMQIPKMLAWWPIVYDLTGASVADGALMISWALILYKRMFLAYIALALAMLFHPVAGIHGFIIGLILYLSRSDFKSLMNEFKLWKTYVGVIFICAGFFINYILYLQSLDGFKLDDATFLNIIVNFRHPHHYLPSHFDIEVVISFIVFALSFLYMWNQVKEYLYNKKIVTLVVFYSVSMMIIGWLFTEVFPTRLAASIIPFRGFSILIPIYMLVLAYFMHEKLMDKKYLSFLLLTLPFMPYNSVGLTWYLLPNSHEMVLPTIILVIVFSIIVANDLKPKYFNIFNRPLTILLSNSNFYKTIAVSSVFCVLFAIFRFSVFIPDFNNSPAIYKWLSENTTTSDIIVTELYAASNQKIRLLSKRPVVISKDFPFLEKYYLEWYERYKDVYVIQKNSRGYIDKRSSEDLNVLLDKYNASILLRTIALDSIDHFELIGRAEGEKSEVLIYKNISLVR